VWREVDLLNARDARMTSQENLAVHVIVEKQHLPLQRVPQQQEIAGVGAKKTLHLGGKNVSGKNVLDVHSVPLQRVPHQQEIAGLGAKKTLHLGRKNVSGEIVMDVHRVRQDGFRDVKSCLCDGTMHSDI